MLLLLLSVVIVAFTFAGTKAISMLLTIMDLLISGVVVVFVVNKSVGSNEPKP